MKLRSGTHTQTPDTISKRSQHSAPSSLLELPLEIRYMIYGCVSGYQTIHIYDASPLELDLSWLRICRQIHDEARLIPYQTLTFSFHRWEVLRAVMKRHKHVKSIREIRLQIDMDELYKACHLVYWQWTFDRMVDNMISLSNIRIDMWKEDADETIFHRADDGDGYDSVTEVLLSLKGLPLKSALVTLRDGMDKIFYGLDDVPKEMKDWDKWTPTERRCWTERVEKGLLEVSARSRRCSASMS